MPELPSSAAAERNKAPILAALREVLGPAGAALEIASGTGQHVACFAQSFPDWTWQPSDVDEGMLPVIAARIAEAGLANVRVPVLLDVTQPPWPSAGPPFGTAFDGIYCANMLHIAPWAACAGLMRGAARCLRAGGLLLVYGPFLEADVPTASSNLAFDASLRARDPAWGIRPLDAVAGEARKEGLVLTQRRAMPANNLLLVFSST